MKKIKLLFVILIAIISLEANARSYSLFYGFGELFNPHSYRAGISNYEAILNVNQGFGIIKNFYFGNSYVSFTPLFITKDANIGIYGAIGYDYTFWRLFYLKMEFNTATSFGNYGASQAIIGLGLYW